MTNNAPSTLQEAIVNQNLNDDLHCSSSLVLFYGQVYIETALRNSAFHSYLVLEMFLIFVSREIEVRKLRYLQFSSNMMIISTFKRLVSKLGLRFLTLETSKPQQEVILWVLLIHWETSGFTYKLIDYFMFTVAAAEPVRISFSE